MSSEDKETGQPSVLPAVDESAGKAGAVASDTAIAGTASKAGRKDEEEEMEEEESDEEYVS